MQSNSRTANSLRNSTLGLISQLSCTMINFIVRTVFIHTLNKEYLGVDVIAIGVPTVVDAATLTNDVLDIAIDNLMKESDESSNFYNMLKKLKEDEKYQLIKDSLDPYDQNLIVTPKDIDDTIENL